MLCHLTFLNLLYEIFCKSPFCASRDLIVLLDFWKICIPPPFENYVITPNSIILLNKLTVITPPHFYVAQGIVTLLITGHHCHRITSQLNPLNLLKPHFFKTNFSILLPFKSTYSKSSFQAYTLFTYQMHATCTVHPNLLYPIAVTLYVECIFSRSSLCSFSIFYRPE